MSKIIAPKKWPIRHRNAAPKPKMTEYQLQRALFKYWLAKKTPNSSLIHIPNESKRSAAAGWKLKNIGLHPGFPDLLVKGDQNVLGCVPECILIELKRPGVIATPERRAQLEELTDKGWTVWCVNDLDFAIRLLEEYGVVYP